MNNLKKSLVLSFAQKYSELLIGFCASVILARLLIPEEVGLYSIVATIIVIAHMIRDFGVSSYIVQEDDLTDEKLISAFLVTFTWSYTIALLLFLNAQNIADFFEREEINIIINHVLFNFLIIPFGSVSLSLLRKDMNFSALFKVNVTSALVGAIVSVSLAFNGFSFMSLVWGSIATTFTTVCLSSFFRKKIKLVFPSSNNIKNVFMFGSKSSYIYILFMSVSQLPEIIIGKFFGMVNVGLYSRANGLVMLFHMGVMQGIVPVLLPHLVNEMKKKGDIKQEYLKCVNYICIVAWPFFIFLALMSEKIISFLYGANWVLAAPLVTWLALAGAIVSVYSINTHVFVATKNINSDVKNQSISQALSFIIIIAASFFSLQILLMSIVLARLVSLIVSTYYLCSATNMVAYDIFSTLVKPFAVTVISFISIYYISRLEYLNSVSDFFALLISGTLFVLVWLISLKFVKSDIIDAVMK